MLHSSRLMATPSPCRSRGSLGGGTGSARCSYAAAPNEKELISLSHDEAQQDPLLGCSIRKSFGVQSFFGHVVSIDIDAETGERHYHVAYEDGDEEHLFASEIQRLLQPGRISVAGRSFVGSPAGFVPAHTAPPSCRPSFSASRAATPRQSLASHAPAPRARARSSLGASGRRLSRSVFGGAPSSPSDDGAGLGVWWALAGTMVILYAIVWGLPSCISCSVGAGGTKPLDLETAFDHGKGLDLSAETPAWVLPSNDVLLSSLSASAADPGRPVLEAPQPVHGWEPSQSGSTSFAEVTGKRQHSWEDGASAEAATGGPTKFTMEEVMPAVREALAGRSAGADTGLVGPALARLRGSAAEALAAGLTSLADLAESTAVVAITMGLLATALVLIAGNIWKQPEAEEPGSAPSPAAVSFVASPAHGGGPFVAPSPWSGGGSSAGDLGAAALPMLGESVGPVDGRQVQVGLFYLANVGEEQKVVKTTGLNAAEGSVTVRVCDVNWSKNGVPSFRLTQYSCKLSLANLLQGPFAITAGRAPSQVAQLFQKVFSAVAPPQAGAAVELGGVQNRYGDVSQQRFRYMSAIRKMEELGFQDSQELRTVLTACGGNVNEAIREFWRDH